MKKLLIVVFGLAFFLSAQDFEYVGSSKCKMCHKKVEKGDQFSKWVASPHAKAFDTLKSEKSAQIAAEKGIEVEAWKAPECLKCHTTGFGAGGYEVKCDDFWNPAADDKAGAKAVKRMESLKGVGCESCHGAGSKYKSKKVKLAIDAGEIDAASVGLLEVNEATCVACHNDEGPTFKSFNFEERVAEIAHPYPAK